MKKFMTIGMMAVLAAGVANAQNDVVIVDQAGGSDASEPQITLETALVSAYVWRGQVYNNDFVAQPQLTLSQYGVSLNVWGNYDLKENINGTAGNFSEIDFSLAYTLPIDINEMSFDVGLINYNFPNSANKSTSELFASAKVLSWKDYVIPSVTVFGDIVEVHGTYVLFDVVAPYQVSDYFAVEAGISAGYGNTAYNTAYWTGTADAGWNDYNFYGNASYEIVDGVTVSANLTYTMLEGGDVRDGAKGKYEADNKVWGGVNIAYDF
ncbi:MAG: hypothetical protein K9M54_03370 [Kiritimatiellales bacterium]|nr:hypothetical protein [Kiritimatiellales bacterium]MCF7864440.1 hypothetical protein [Kiritimatiellales bacterium]